MSVKKIILGVLCILFFSTNSQAALKFSLAPEFGIMGGTTEYEMDIIAVSDSFGTIPVAGTWHLTSLLEYPLNTTIGGLSGELRSAEDSNRWSVGLKFLTNLTDPTNKMLNSDWQGYSSLFPYTQFSYTESNAEMNMYILDLELRFRIAQKRNMDISIIAGGRYQKIDQDIVNLDGWQRTFNEDSIFYDPSFSFSRFQDTVVGTYEIEFKQFKIGLHSDIYLSDKITSQVRVMFAPASFKDIDDHVLRNKLSTSDGEGNGYIFGFNLRYDKSGSKLSFIQLSTSYNYYSANGAQTQEWYGDEMRFNQETQQYEVAVEKDTIFRGIPHTIRTKQYSVSLQLGFKL